MSGPGGEIVLSRTEDGRSQIQFRPVCGTVWLTQTQLICSIRAVPNINKYITSILELRTRRRQQPSMADWVVAADRSIRMNDMPVLTGAGSVPAEAAREQRTSGSSASMYSAASWKPCPQRSKHSVRSGTYSPTHTQTPFRSMSNSTIPETRDDYEGSV